VNGRKNICNSFVSKDMGVIQLSGINEATGSVYLHRRIDIRLIPYQSFYTGLLYFTGSDFFNTRKKRFHSFFFLSFFFLSHHFFLFIAEMRTIALERGFTLSEYSLRPIGTYNNICRNDILVSC
jgi:DNA polymerase beta